MVDSTSAAGSSAAAGASSASNGALSSLSNNFDTFLTLLTTQMKNQDPLSPMDSTQFTQQLTQMTGVQQQLLTNDLLKQLVGNSASGISAAVSLIGKNVRAVSDDAALAKGQASWIYKLDQAATDVKAEVLDSKGNVVAVASPDGKTAGEHTFTWNGKGISGSTLPDGTYTLRLTAKDSAGAAVTSTSYVEGIVGSVEQDSGTTMVNINGGKVPWDKVTNITLPDTTGGNTTTASSGSSGAANSNTDDGKSSSAAA
jgi:flagellar basal-body rod modification protein FlgD